MSVTAGTLGGSGIIAGAVTIGTGSGEGAALAPAAGTKGQATLRTQGQLLFNKDGFYIYTFRSKGSKAQTDEVIANGVRISSWATLNFSGQV